MNRKAVPWHDVRFRGYGQNKIVHIAHTNASGFTFMVRALSLLWWGVLRWLEHGVFHVSKGAREDGGRARVHQATAVA